MMYFILAWALLSSISVYYAFKAYDKQKERLTKEQEADREYFRKLKKEILDDLRRRD